MSENTTYWLARTGTPGHKHCKQAWDDVNARTKQWRNSFERLASAMGFDDRLPFYFFVNGQGWTSDLSTRPVDNVAVFLDSKELLTINETRRRLCELGEKFKAHGFETKVTTARNLSNGRQHLKLVLRKKVDKDRFREIVGELPCRQDVRRSLGRILAASHPTIKENTLFASPGIRELNDGSWLLETTESAFSEGWVKYLAADGFERLKAWEGLKLIEEDQEPKTNTKKAKIA